MVLSLIYILRRYALLLFIIISSGIFSQNKDSLSHNLFEVTIESNKIRQLQPSKKIITFDSLLLQKYNTTSLADLFANQSTIHIKNYGNGNIATTSMRGGNANHTAILWNGLNIQNAMLGQTDLSIIPTMFFNNVLLQYGGGSALNGSGAIGGSINLGNNIAFNKGYETQLQISAGSFDTRKIATSVLLSYKKISSCTKLYYNNSQNNYKYIDTTDKENINKQITHANFTTKGLMQELSFLINTNQTINVRAWYNKAYRNLPSYTNATSKQQQEDENLKLTADWNYNKQHLKSITRVAYFNDALNYSDSLASIYSYSKVKTIIGESDNTYTIKNHTINFGINLTQNKINTLNYVIPRELNKIALFAAYQVWLIPSKLNFNIALRKEFTNINLVPFTGNAGLYYHLTKKINVKINANKSFRQPTLNDLYWAQGGNPYLKPEESYEYESGLEFKHQKNKWIFNIEATYFNRHTTNWITWLPSANTYWSPVNIAKVHSRGTETKTEITYSTKKITINLNINTTYVLSTNQKLINENDNSLDRQLIYTPRYTGQAGLSLICKQFYILFNNHYTGYRFTTTDNTTWLNPYLISSIKVSHKLNYKNTGVECFASCNNLFNKNYQVIANRPMPLRNFEAGILIHCRKNKIK